VSTLTLEEVAFDDSLAQVLIAEVQQEYVVRYGGPDETAVDGAQFAAPYGAFFVAWVGEVAVGCAGLRRHDHDVVEIKRMFVRAAHRRRGHARTLLRALEDRARRDGYRRVVLETGLAQPEAIALYTSEGYRPIEGFGHYRDEPLSRSFGKDVAQPS
jgi:GNAT superfamily N-acetyltransferase